MADMDMDRLADALVTGAKRYVDERLATFDNRLRVVETQVAAPRAEPVGIVDNFKSDTGVLILTLSNGKKLETGIRDGANGRDGKDGKDGQSPAPEAVAAIAKREIDAALVSRAEAHDRQGPDDQEIRALILDAVASAIAELAPSPGPPGRDGKDGAPGADGKSIGVEDLRPALEAAVSARMATIADGRDGKDGRDGTGLAGALIDRNGELILTLTNGATLSLGRIVGKDGAPGRDGFGLADLSVSLAEDGRTAVLKFESGEIVKEFALPFPVMLDRGVWREGKYVAGDFVSYRGSGFVAQRETSDVPETSDAWRLAVKRGRDGKDGKLVEPKPKTPLKVGG